MKDFARRVELLRSDTPEQFVELHSWRERPMNCRVNRHMVPSASKLAKSSCPLELKLLELTILLMTLRFFGRAAVRERLEQLLQDTLTEWGETLKTAKTQRLIKHSSWGNSA